MAQGALGAAGVRRVGYGLEVGSIVRTAGGAGHIVSPRAQLVYLGFDAAATRTGRPTVVT